MPIKKATKTKAKSKPKVATKKTKSVAAKSKTKTSKAAKKTTKAKTKTSAAKTKSVKAKTSKVQAKSKASSSAQKQKSHSASRSSQPTARQSQSTQRQSSSWQTQQPSSRQKNPSGVDVIKAVVRPQTFEPLWGATNQSPSPSPNATEAQHEDDEEAFHDWHALRKEAKTLSEISDPDQFEHDLTRIFSRCQHLTPQQISDGLSSLRDVVDVPQYGFGSQPRHKKRHANIDHMVLLRAAFKASPQDASNIVRGLIQAQLTDVRTPSEAEGRVLHFQQGN